MNSDHDQTAEYLGPLCKIHLSDEEKKTLGQSLNKVLKYMALLDEIDVKDTPPCTHIIETMVNVMQEDEEGPPFDRKTFLQNLPDHVGGMIKVPLIIQFEE